MAPTGIVPPATVAKITMPVSDRKRLVGASVPAGCTKALPSAALPAAATLMSLSNSAGAAAIGVSSMPR
jgi:hypothetical protein